MVYNNNIPQATDRPSDSQQDLLNNFIALKTYLDRNHVEISNPTGDTEEGKHTFLQLPEQSAAPTTASNEGGLYSKVGTISTETELFFRRENNGSEIAFTEFLGAIPGWTRLPSGILLKWGLTSSGGGAQNVVFPVAANIPVFTSIFNVSLTVEDNSATPNTFVTLRSFNTTSMNVYGSSRTSTSASGATFRFLAIGIG